MTVEYNQDGMIALGKPVTLPEVLDLLIVGGGPAGTAAAFRAKELGLSALVVDYDDLMKRIRDYAKDKQILPDFGGGDKMRFPKGDALIDALAFDPIDKDEMCKSWKELYVQHNIPAQIGIELTGLQQRDDGVWQVKTWNHNLKQEQLFLAKHVALGIGRGVPRRFDIPGNTDGIAYRLADAAAYISGPVLVIGGGTSAAEAVIEISKAKIREKDPSAVYWSYRGDKLPKVSKALADVFFDAYLGNGNIRYFPNSEPVAVVTGDDKKEYLSVRIDRRTIAARPSETVQYEFTKELCIACIGEDIPEAFLNSMGIFMVTGGPSNKKRMTVTPLLETQQSNVYLIGDILSQAYLETEDFSADPAAFKEIKHRGNVKSALVDGVFIAEVVAQKVAGKKDISVQVQLQEAPAQAPAAEKKEAPALTVVVEAEGPPKESVIPAHAVEEHAAHLVKLIAGNVEEDEFPIHSNGVTTIGRKGTDIAFPDDVLLSEKHASISHGNEGYFLRDDGSVNGVFYRAPEGKPLEVLPGTLLRMGKQFLLFTFDGGKPGFIHYDKSGKEVKRYTLEEGKTIVLGRDAPDVILDSNDGTLSRRHLSIVVRESKTFIKDLKSLNGTYLKVKTAVKLEDGDQFKVGSQSFKLALRKEISNHEELTILRAAPPAEVLEKPAEPAKKEEPKPEPKPAAAPPKEAAKAPAAAGELAVTFKNEGQTIPFQKGQSVCDVAEKNKVKLKAECHSGICGSDPVRIIAGAENINPLGDDEKGTLEDICGLPPGECRLACMVKPTGPIEVEIVES